MSDVPKCTSWRGHKFEGRFSSEPAGNLEVDRGTYRAVQLLADFSTKRTYECDVCVRCGHVVKPPSKAA